MTILAAAAAAAVAGYCCCASPSPHDCPRRCNPPYRL